MSEETCAIVGVGPGIGLAVARRFGREGFRIGMLARSAEKLEGHRRDLERLGIVADGFPADAGDAAQIRAAMASLSAALGDPSVLVYNAAVLRPGHPSKLERDRLLADFQVNVAGALVATQAVLPAMRERKRGTILFTGGGLALDPFPQFASLAIGKAGLRSLALSLSKELEGDGIHVATVTVAGLVKTGTHTDPDAIAETYYQLHEQKGAWEREIVLR